MVRLRRTEQIEVLKKVPLFSELSKRQLNAIAKQAKQVTLAAGTVLACQGGVGREFHILVEGNARVEKGRKVIRKLSTGDTSGEISLIDEGPRTATVVAESQIELLVLNTSSFRALLDSVPGLQRKLLLTVCGYLRNAKAA